MTLECIIGTAGLPRHIRFGIVGLREIIFLSKGGVKIWN